MDMQISSRIQPFIWQDYIPALFPQIITLLTSSTSFEISKLM